MCHMDKETKVCLIRVVVFIVYLHIGALVFMITEGKAPSEGNAKEIIRTLQKKIIKKYNMTESEFKHLVEEIKAGCSGEPLEWTFPLSTSFTFQLLTTIGKCVDVLLILRLYLLLMPVIGAETGSFKKKY